MFDGLASLLVLNLSSNGLESIGQASFSGLDQLLQLDLQVNNLVGLDADIFDSDFNIHQLTIRLEDNPIDCDSSICWLVQAQDDTSTRLTGTCASPPNLIGTSLQSLREEDVCFQNPSGTINVVTWLLDFPLLAPILEPV